MNTARNELKAALNLILMNGQLAAKWTPRKGDIACKLRAFFGMSPKQYRKSLVDMTSVVETQMCNNEWDSIDFNHVPSMASARYKKAFNRHTTKFAEYVAALVRGDEGVKVNAGAIFPHTVLQGLIDPYLCTGTKVELDHIMAQWNALPNYMGESKVLPMVDVSGSMYQVVGGNGGTSVMCAHVAIALGLYIADKNTGAFKDTFLTFSGNPKLSVLHGNIVEKTQQLVQADWAMNTNLNAAFAEILRAAINGKVPQDEMPAMVLIFSDMQFDACVRHDDSAMEMIERQYRDAGYEVPQVVFWNLRAVDNVPVSAHKTGAALVSGFSPAIMTSLLAADMESFTPYGIMLKTIMSPRYDLG